LQAAFHGISIRCAGSGLVYSNAMCEWAPDVLRIQQRCFQVGIAVQPDSNESVPRAAQAQPSQRPDRAAVDWAAIEAHPRFQELHRRKSRFLWGLMAFSVLYYFLLPVGAAYWPELFRRPVWGPVNVGLLFALSEFVVAWLVALVYSRHAGRHFDAMAADIQQLANGVLR